MSRTQAAAPNVRQPLYSFHLPPPGHSSLQASISLKRRSIEILLRGQRIARHITART